MAAIGPRGDSYDEFTRLTETDTSLAQNKHSLDYIKISFNTLKFKLILGMFRCPLFRVPLIIPNMLLFSLICSYVKLNKDISL